MTLPECSHFVNGAIMPTTLLFKHCGIAHLFLNLQNNEDYHRHRQTTDRKQSIEFYFWLYLLNLFIDIRHQSRLRIDPLDNVLRNNKKNQQIHSFKIHSFKILSLKMATFEVNGVWLGWRTFPFVKDLC